MIRALQLLLLGAASFVAVYLFMGLEQAPSDVPAADTSAALPSSEIETGSVSPQATVSESAAGSPEATSGEAAPKKIELRSGAETPLPEATPRLIRDVTPNTMTAGPRLTATVAQADPPPAKGTARTERLFNPIVVNAGTIKVRDREIHLAGIAPSEFEMVCGEGATAWPCGRMARAALQRFIHSRAIECKVPAGADKIPDPAECQVGGDDMSAWLVAQGWAKRSGSALADQENKAKDAKLGLWSPGRPKTQSADVAAGD